MEDIVENSRGSLKPGKVAVAVLAALVMYAFATNCAFKYDIEKSYDKNEAQRTAENARHDKAITYLDGLYDKENTRHDKAITKLDDQADDVEERAKKMEERAKRVREAREAERAEEAAGQ